MVFVVGKRLAVAVIEPMAEEEGFFRGCVCSDGLSPVEQALANLSGALGGDGAITLSSAGVD